MESERTTFESFVDSTADKQNLGSTREVWRTRNQTASGETVEHYIKEKRSDAELEILKFLHGRGISEELLMFDSRQLAIGKIEGESLLDRLETLVHANLNRIERVEPARETSDPKFKIHKSIYEFLPPEELARNPALKAFVADYFSKLFFLWMNGIVHNDIKGDNIMVGNEGVRVLDFGEARIYPNDPRHDWDYDYRSDVARASELMRRLNKKFGLLTRRMREDYDIAKSGANGFIHGLYDAYSKNNVGLEQRPAFLSNRFGQDLLPAIGKYLADIQFPEEVRAEVARKTSELINQAVSRKEQKLAA